MPVFFIKKKNNTFYLVQNYTYNQKQISTSLDLQAYYKTPKYIVLYQAEYALELQ